MSIVIVSPTQVEIDGANYGAVADAIANNPQLTSAIQLALNEWGSDLMQQVTDVPSLRSHISQLEQELEGYRNPPQPTHDYLGFDDALLNPEEGLSLFWFVRSMADAYPAPVGTAYTDFSRVITKGMIVPSMSLDAFQSCINNLFGAFTSVGAEFSSSQVALMRSLLDQYGFQAIAFPLGV